MDIILYLIQLIQHLYKQNCWLVLFICKYILLKQWAYDDSKSSAYQKFKIDELPRIISYEQDWKWNDLITYYEQRYGKNIKPTFRGVECDIPDDCTRPVCNAPKPYLTWNDGKKKSQIRCKVCLNLHSPSDDNRFSKTHKLRYPHCSRILEPIKNRKHFIIHKCKNSKCPFYLHNLKKVKKEHLSEEKSKYKLHYIYREFTIDFFRMDLNSLPKNASSLKFSKFDKNVMGLCLTYKVNLGLSLSKTAEALKEIHGIHISHQQVSNYCKTAAICIKPFTDNYDYGVGKAFTADETHIKIRGLKGYVWFIMDAAKRAIIGYQISDNRGVGSCILAMRMAFRHLKELPKDFRFIADGYSAYPLAAQQFYRVSEGKINFDITQVIGLTNGDAVSTEFRPLKQMIERLNRTYKQSYRPTNGFSNIDGANYDLALWVTYYNFLRPHKEFKYKPPVQDSGLAMAGNMPGKWQYLIAMGQQTIMCMQQNCS